MKKFFSNQIASLLFSIIFSSIIFSSCFETADESSTTKTTVESNVEQNVQEESPKTPIDEPKKPVIADQDGDTIADEVDNCAKIANVDQIDTDKDEAGDICDNCMEVSNPEQSDSDNNAIGDLCDKKDEKAAEDESAKEKELVTYYEDLDNDGYGNPNSFYKSDAKPVGYVLNNSDCDDESDLTNPGSVEMCNGSDDNCNNDIDEGLLFVTYFDDFDGDGFGDVNFSVESCNGKEAGYVLDSTDCNDFDLTIFPGAQEIPSDFSDNNCNEVTDEELITCESVNNVDSSTDGVFVTDIICTINPLIEGYSVEFESVSRYDYSIGNVPIETFSEGLPNSINGIFTFTFQTESDSILSSDSCERVEIIYTLKDKSGKSLSNGNFALVTEENCP